MPQLILFPDTPTPTTIAIKKGTLVYEFPRMIWDMAEATFDQQYYPGRDVKALAMAISHELMPESPEDPFSEKRLASCLLSVKGRNGGLKTQRLRRMQNHEC